MACQRGLRAALRLESLDSSPGFLMVTVGRRGTKTPNRHHGRTVGRSDGLTGGQNMPLLSK